MIKIENTSIPGKLALEQLSLISLSNENIFSSALDLIPNITNSVTQSLNYLSTVTNDFVKNKFKLVGFTFSTMSAIEKANYDSIKKVYIEVPEGFVGNFPSYIKDLNQSITFFERVTLTLLETFYVYVSSFVTNKDAKLSLKDNTFMFKENQKHREEIIKNISNHFTTANIGKAVLGECFDNNSEITKSIKDTNNLIKRINAHDLSRVQNRVSRLVKALDIAIEQGKNGGYTTASKESLMNLAQGAFEVAEQVDFFAVTVYRIKALGFSMEQIENKLSKIL